MLAYFAGKKVDKIPAGYWFHYPNTLSVEEMIAEHVKLYRESDMDVVKIMQDYRYPIEGEINCAEDWYKISVKGTDSPEFAKFKAVIEGIRKEVGDDVLIFMTMFGPTKAVSMHYGDDVFMKYAKSDPEAVAAGIQIVTDALAKWARAYMECGADGIYYSAQFGEVGRFEKEEWEKLVKPFDLQILGVAQSMENRYNMLHICGEPEYQFRVHLDWFTEYPGELVNWSVKDNHVSLAEGKKMFMRPILGGMNNKGNLLKGTDAAIEAETEGIIKGFGAEGLMIGADCTIQGEGISIPKLAVSIAKAHAYEI